jgi:hypothetical protein
MAAPVAALFAVSDDASDQSIAAMDVILNWDPNRMELLGALATGPYNWMFAGFPDDSGLDGLNDTFTDGDALFVAWAKLPPSAPAYATPAGLEVITFQFYAANEADAAQLDVPGVQGSFSQTVVWDGETPALDVTGTLGDALVEIFLRCKPGTVNAGNNDIIDVLFLNGSAGDEDHKVFVEEGDLIWAGILQPPVPENGKYIVTANYGIPTVASERQLPASVGFFCQPLLFNHGADPDAVWNNIGKEARVGASAYFDDLPIPDPPRAPAVFLELHAGDPVYLPMGTEVTFQGVIKDNGSVSPKKGSTTNVIVLVVL